MKRSLAPDWGHQLESSKKTVLQSHVSVDGSSFFTLSWVVSKWDGSVVKDKNQMFSFAKAHHCTAFEKIW